MADRAGLAQIRRESCKINYLAGADFGRVYHHCDPPSSQRRERCPLALSFADYPFGSGFGP